jgi:transposase
MLITLFSLQEKPMVAYAALDVSMRTTCIHIVDETGRRLWRGKAGTDPCLIADALAAHAPQLVRVGLETGCWSTWLHHGLAARGLPVVCMDARQAKAALSLKINKTDANDAEGLAQLLRTGLFREVRVKSWGAMLIRTLVRARYGLLRTQLDLANQLRGALRTFGLMLGTGGARRFDAQVREHLAARPDLAPLGSALLEAWNAVRQQVYRLDREIRAAVRRDRACRLLMTAPGVGCITAVSYVAAVEDPRGFRSGRAVSAWIGLTPRRYQSGEIDVSGRISRQGDKLLRSYLYEAAAHVLTRARAASALRRWGLELRARIGFKRAVVAVARKLSVVLHAMWKDDQPFDAGAATMAA